MRQFHFPFNLLGTGYVCLMVCCGLLLLAGSFVTCQQQLDSKFYDRTCPALTRIVRSGVWSALSNDTRMGASLLRLHFHDCIVNGCDASVLLDDTPTMAGEKGSPANNNSARGFEVIDAIKANVEKVCPSTVSCADILTLAARDAVVLAGGPWWAVDLGRRDGRVAKLSDTQQLPSPFDPLDNITAKFTSKGLDLKDVVVLSGAHTIGFAQCFTFKTRLFDFSGTGNPDPALDESLLSDLQRRCPKNQDSSDSNLAPLDRVTSNRFDNAYYANLLNGSGVLLSDQALMESNSTANLVRAYTRFPRLFFKEFSDSMVKLGNLGVLMGTDGEIRANCRVVNS